ncbi:MAG: GEVED domain-containing protein [Ferruginibacter sp.]
MQNKTTLNRVGQVLRNSFLILGLAFWGANLSAQTVSTSSGTNYLHDYSINNPASLFQTFVIENTNPTARTLSSMTMFMAPYFGNGGASTIRLYYSATSLSGVPTVTTPIWTQIATGNLTVPAVLTEVTVLTGINFIIPANTQYRFAIEATKGLTFSFTPTPTPNNFTNGGIVLKVGNFTIAGLNVGYAGLFPTPNAGNTPTFFGGSVTLTGAAPCAGTPNPGNTITSSANVCPGIPFTLTPQNATDGSGVTYQWQSGPSATGPFTNVGAGGTNSSYTTTLTATTFYRVIVTCGANSGTSVPVAVNLNPPSQCYCAAGATSTAFEKISNVKIGTINRTSTSTAGYENFITDTTILQRQNPTTITVTISTAFSSDQVLVWIDLNQDGDFIDAGENVYTSALGVGPHVGTITVPATASLGFTRMRVRMHDTFGGNATPCGNSTYGQVEDYTVNITPCVPVTVTNQPVASTIMCGGNSTFTFGATGTGITYLWQYRVNATSPWINLTDGPNYSGVTTNTLTVINAPVTFNGYQYRVIYTGACSGTDFSNIVTLTVNPLLATVSTGTSISRCKGSGTAITITNVPSTTSATFNSTAAVPIPDANPTGVQSPITVSGIPAGATISEVRVTFNLPHTYVGDLDINLIAPNNGNLNLVGSLNNGTGSNSTANFTNTVISSLGTVALSGAPAPRTGTFKADALPGYGPTGSIQNVTSFAGLISVPNGIWKLAAADFFGGDVGTITNWSITIFYGAPATGVFSPNTGLFTDATYTTPYTGQPINTVYANPQVTTAYTVTVTTPTCVSSPLTINYTVNNPIVGTSTVANKAVCVGGTTSFTATAPTSGNNIQHQWKVSTDNGVTFTNVTNTGVYTGATTSTLTITGALLTMNNYKYKDSLFVPSCSSNIVTNVATLTVNPNPVVVISANPFTQLTPGMTTTLSAAVSPNAGATYQWFRNGVLIPGATGSTLVVDIDGLGEYTVNVTDVNGCSGSSTSSISITAGSSDIVFIYPSPNTGQFQIRFNSAAGNTNLSRFVNIYDSKGARIYSRSYPVTVPFERLDVDLRNHGKGVYMVELADRNGARLKAGRVVVF